MVYPIEWGNERTSERGAAAAVPWLGHACSARIISNVPTIALTMLRAGHVFARCNCAIAQPRSQLPVPVPVARGSGNWCQQWQWQTAPRLKPPAGVSATTAGSNVEASWAGHWQLGHASGVNASYT